MAIVKVNTTPLPRPEAALDSVTLELTPQEAIFLRTVLLHVGGCPDRSPRRYNAEISAALDDAHVPSASTSAGASAFTGAIYCSTNSKVRLDAALAKWKARL